ncbi:MAG: class I adenylate cyclase [Deltaproteobacteria bacterium]|nr:class I adenylate cyclase [Deltaproteobacteria bacterium]
MLFGHYTRLRREYAYDLCPEKASVAFEIIPALLSLNEPDLPGFVSGGTEWCGISGMNSAQKLKQTVHEYFPEGRNKNINYQACLVSRPSIESLFLMGSTGTVAQTCKSDFDYWVCIEGSHVSGEGYDKLVAKTAQIECWCQSKFDMEVHFFINDLDHIRRNDFGRADEESTGSSQKKFLKEECYRTMLLVAGKIPFWWVVPPAVDQETYRQYWDGLARKQPYDLDEYVDLGCLEDVSRDEFLGTALWQLTKGIKDPFKAVLKMAMMERYLSETFRGPLLCNTVKERVQKGAKSLRDVDPYLLMVEAILAFYEEQGRSEEMDLLRKAFYLKSNPEISRARLSRHCDGKVEIFRKLMEKWKWSLDQVEDLNQMERWSYARQLKFSGEINGFFFSTYRRLSESLAVRERQAIDDQDLTLLGRRIYALYARQGNKLQLSPFLTSRSLVLDRCSFQYERDGSGRTRWVLYDATRYLMDKSGTKTQVFAAERVARAAAWLIFNGLFDQYATAVGMPSNPSGLTLSDLLDLLKHLKGFFPPGSEQVGAAEGLREDAMCEKMMIVVNVEEGLRISEPVSMDIISRNTWGEMFTESHPLGEGLDVVRGYLQDLMGRGPVELASVLKVHVPKSIHETDTKRRITQMVVQNLPAISSSSPPSSSPPSCEEWPKQGLA